MRRNRLASAMALTLLLSVTTACNSTNRVDLEAGRTQATIAPLAGAESATTFVEQSATATAPRPGASTGATAGRAATGAVTGGGARPGAGTGRVGLGVSDTEIKIGIVLVYGGQAMGNFIGVALDFGDTRAQAEAAVNYVNAHGGVAGRKVKPVYYVFDLARPGLTDGQSEQEACAKWTEDDRVYAIVNNSLARQALLVCLAKRGVPGIHVGMPIDEHTLQTYRNYWYSGYGGPGLTLDRQAELQVKGLAARNWFGSNAVVGIEYFDDPAYKRVVDQTWVPLLKAAGVKKIVTQGAPRGGADGATSYAVRFRNEGVTHVLFQGEGGLYPLFFMRGADSQGYYPKYGLNTDMAPAAGLQGTAPDAQLRNSVGVGWTPIVDVDANHDPGPVNDANSLCLDINRKAGQDMSKRQPQITALSYCHGLWMFQQALASQRDVTVGSLAAGVAALGTSFKSPGVYATRFSLQMHDGVDAYRDFDYNAGCSCFVYSSGVKPFPS